MSSDLRQTAAYRIVREIIDHSWGADEALSDEDLIKICDMFRQIGGKWEPLIDGDLDAVCNLEHVIEGFINSRTVGKIAANIARIK